MNSEWKNDIRYTKNHTIADIERWCKIYGEEQFRQYYALSKLNYEKKKVPFGVIQECAIYDMKLSKSLFCTLRLVEYQLRSEILQVYDTNEFLKNIVNIMGKTHCAKNKFAKKIINREIDLFSYLNELVFGDIEKIMIYMIDKDMRETKKSTIKAIRELRNDIMHHHLILSQDIEHVQNRIEILLSEIRDKKLQKEKCDEINSLATYPNGSVKYYVVKVSV